MDAKRRTEQTILHIFSGQIPPTQPFLGFTVFAAIGIWNSATAT
jgi:hypothetical protein